MAQEELSEEYVTRQLKEEARGSSLLYSSLGVDAFRPQRRATPALKPNTRFLRAIIKETNSHNAALLRKEVETKGPGQQHGSQSTDKEGQNSRRSKGHGYHDSPDNSASDDHKRRRQRRSRDQSMPKESRNRHGKKRREQRRRSPDRSKSKEPQERNCKHRENSSRHSQPDRSRSPHRKRRSRHRHHRDGDFSDSSQSNHHKNHHRSREDHKTSRRPHRHREARRSPSPGSSKLERIVGKSRDPYDETAATIEHRKGSPSAISPIKSQRNNGTDSDPLEHIIGPIMNVKTSLARGRGARKSRSDMDAHFRSGYDPTTDVQPNSDDDNDWEQALEALRDRERWKKLGINRLKEAGFSEQDIKRWKQGGEQDQTDIRWKRTGEGREWDRGKVVTIDGDIATLPEWAKP